MGLVSFDVMCDKQKKKKQMQNQNQNQNQIITIKSEGEGESKVQTIDMESKSNATNAQLEKIRKWRDTRIIMHINVFQVQRLGLRTRITFGSCERI